MDSLKQLQEQHDYFKNGMAELQDYIDKMDPKIKQLQQELEQMKLLAKTGADALIATANDGLELVSQNEALAAQVEQLQSVITGKTLDLVRCGIGSNYGGKPYEEAMARYYEPMAQALMLSPVQCLAEIKARAVEVVRDHYKNKFPATEKFTAAWIVEGIEQYAKELRQTAKGGE